MSLRVKIGDGEYRNVDDLKFVAGNGVGFSDAAGLSTDDLDLTVGISEITTLQLTSDVYVAVGDGAPVDYTDGSPPATGEGVYGKGSLYSDYTNGKLYINTGTQAEPAWTLVGSQT